MEIEFQSEDELKKPIPEGTVALVKLRRAYDYEARQPLPLGELKQGRTRTDKTPYIVIPVEVVDGEHAGEWASTTLFVRGGDRSFRSAFQVITGIDISQGGKVDFSDFTEKLKTGIFEVELGPERPRKGSDEPPKYTEVKKWIARVGERDDLDDEGSAPEAPEAEEEVDDKDIPF